MSKAFALVAALACFLPAVTACSSSNNNSTTSSKKDSGATDASDEDAGDAGEDDAGDSGPACTAAVHSSTVTSISKGGGVLTIKNPTTCKTCVTANCPDICTLTDGLSCATSNCATECAPVVPDAGATTDAGESEGGTSSEGGASSANCTKLASCCATVGLVSASLGTSCTQASSSGDDSVCKQVITQINGVAPVCN